MTEFNYCHGPNCHTYHTQGRIRGVKGNKVLRTRKINGQSWYSQETFDRSIYSHFCNMRCLMDYLEKHKRQVIAIEPRHEPLETPIDVQQTQETDWRGNPYTRQTIVERGAN
jgi:hypothetical protein